MTGETDNGYAPTAPDGSAGPFEVGLGVTIASKTEAPVALTPLKPFELQGGSRLRRLNIECASLSKPEACVIARGKDVTLERTSVAHAAGLGLHLKLEGATAVVLGGSFVEAPIRVDAKGNELRVRGTTFIVPAGLAGGIEANDPSPGSQVIEVGFDDAATTFSSAGGPWLRADGAKSVIVRNVKGTGGGSSEVGKVTSAIDVRNVTDTAALAGVSVSDAATGVFAAATKLTIDTSTITKVDIGAVLSGFGATTTVNGLSVSEAKAVGVRLERGTISVPGTLDVKWAQRGPFVSNNPLVGIEIDQANVTVTGSTTVEHCSGTSIRQAGGTLVAAPVPPATGLRVHDTQGPALQLFRGQADITGGGFTESDAPGNSKGLVQVVSVVSTHITLRGTTFEFAGSVQVPTPSPVSLPADVAPKKHIANSSGQPTSVYVLKDQPNPRALLYLEVVNGPNPSVTNYIELLPLP